VIYILLHTAKNFIIPKFCNIKIFTPKSFSKIFFITLTYNFVSFAVSISFENLSKQILTARKRRNEMKFR